jgi:hypothetical protein
MDTKWKTALFRELMRAIRRMPEKRRAEALVLCRHEFSSSTLSRQDAEFKAKKSLSFVRMLTPSSRRGSGGRYVVRDGEVVRGDTAATPSLGVRVRHESGITSEHLERHDKLLRRQHFMDRQ